MVRFKRRPTGPGEVIDRRGSRGGAGGGLIRMGAGGGGIAVIIFLVMTLLGGGGDLGGLVDALGPAVAPQDPAQSPLDPATDPDRDLVVFLGNVLADSQGMWVDIFAQSNVAYQPTDLVIFNGATQSGCGGAQAQSGPHYCPADQQVYMDLDFLQKLQAEFGAAGDTAQAYILAHEVGHHVQNELGILGEVDRIRTNDPGRARDVSIKLELQADCFAGIWLSTLRTGDSAADLEDNDLEEALNAAAAVGDDAIQQQTTGRVSPESWTHGSSEQRLEWLKRGYDTGQPESCDTFS